MCEISSKLTMKTLELCLYRHLGVFIVIFEQVNGAWDARRTDKNEVK